MSNKLIKNQKFNSLTYIEDFGSNKDNRKLGLFLCDCGKETIKPIGRVRVGYIKTCGDGLHMIGKNIKHGMRNTPEYKIWLGIKSRVFGKRDRDIFYNEVGMSEKIKNDFVYFYNMVGKRPGKDYQIERIDNNIGYFEGNIKWAKRTEQQSNKRNSHIVHIGKFVFNGIGEASRHFGVSEQTIDKWCRGYIDKRRISNKNKGIIPPRKGCFYEPRYS